MEKNSLSILADFALSNSIFTAYKLNFFDPFLHDNDAILDINEICEKHGWNNRVLYGIADHLVRRKVLKKIENDNQKYALDFLGNHLIKDGWFSYIIYYVGGYGNILLNADKLAKNELIYGQSITRDINWVAIGTELMSNTSHHQSYKAVLANSSREDSTNILDIGCGTSKFLLELSNVTNCKVAVGIDISVEACNIANDYITKQQPRCKVDIVAGDFIEKKEYLFGKYSQFDIITAMMIIHEYLYEGEEKVIEVLSAVRTLLSENGSFILLDKATNILSESPLYFTEFKLAHDLTNQDLCSFEKWTELISKAGLKIKKHFELPLHTGSVLFECVRQ